MAKLKSSGQGMVVCRICKGPHWTKQCPYKDTLGVALDVQQGLLNLLFVRFITLSAFKITFSRSHKIFVVPLLGGPVRGQNLLENLKENT